MSYRLDNVNPTFTQTSLDRNGYVCDNIIEFANSQNNVNILSNTVISSVTAKMLQSLPWYTSTIMIGINGLSSLLPAIETSIWGATSTGKAFLDFHYAAYGIDGTTALNALRSPLGKVMKGLGIALIAADLGLNIYDSIQRGYTWGQGITSFALTAVKDVGVMFFSAWLSKTVSAKIGAAIGSSGGPVGMIIGAVIGIGIGLLLDYICTILIDLIIR